MCLRNGSSRTGENKPVEVCCLAFSKAYFSTCRFLLNCKVPVFGTRQCISNGSSAVPVGNYYSQSDAKSLLLQRPVLGQLPFFLFMNDGARTLTDSCFIFAEDAKMAKDTSYDLEAVSKWSAGWDLPLDLDKHVFLTADVDRVGNKPLHWVSDVKDLEVIAARDSGPPCQFQVAAYKATVV